MRELLFVCEGNDGTNGRRFRPQLIGDESLDP